MAIKFEKKNYEINLNLRNESNNRPYYNYIVEDIILTYFDVTYGPKILFEEKQDNFKLGLGIKNIIPSIMDLNILNKDFIFGSNSLFLLNRIFEIESPLARGNKETLMITIIFKEIYHNKEIMYILKDFLNNFESIFLVDNQIYKGFYQNSGEIFINNSIEKFEKIKYLFKSISKYILAQKIV